MVSSPPRSPVGSSSMQTSCTSRRMVTQPSSRGSPTRVLMTSWQLLLVSIGYVLGYHQLLLVKTTVCFWLCSHVFPFLKGKYMYHLLGCAHSWEQPLVYEHDDFHRLINWLVLLSHLNIIIQSYKQHTTKKNYKVVPLPVINWFITPHSLYKP